MRTKMNKSNFSKRARSVLAVVVTLSMLLQLLPAQGVRFALGEEDAAEPVLVDTLEHGAGEGEPAGTQAEATDVVAAQPAEQQADDASGAAEEPAGEKSSPSNEVSQTTGDAEADAPAVPHVTIRFDANVPEGDPAPATGEMPDYDYALDAEAKSLLANAYVREGYEFAGWSTTPDGQEVPDDPATSDADESLVAIAVTDGQETCDLAWDEVLDDGAVATRDLGPAVRDCALTLYAKWELAPVEEAAETNSAETATEIDPREDASEGADVQYAEPTDEIEASDTGVSDDCQDLVGAAEDGGSVDAGVGLNTAAEPAVPLPYALENANAAVAGPDETASQLTVGDRDPFANLGGTTQPEPATLPEFAWPAIDATASATNGVVVEVHAPQGAFPPGTTLRVAAVDRDEFLDAVEASTGERPADARAVDISFVCDGREVEPAGVASVDVSLSLKLMVKGGGHQVVHMDDKGCAAYVSNALTTSGHAEFSAASFSVYGIIGTSDDNVYKRIEVVFSDGNGSTYGRQVVRAGDVLNAPSYTPISSTGGEAFKCWACNSSEMTSYVGRKLTANDIEALSNRATSSDDSENLYTVEFVARFGNLVRVYFRQLRFSDGGGAIADTLIADEHGKVNFSEVSYVEANGFRLDGWAEYGSGSGSTPLRSWLLGSADDSATFEKDTDIYPLLTEGYTVTFDMGAANQSYGSMFVEKDASGKGAIEFSKLPSDADLGVKTFYPGYKLGSYDITKGNPSTKTDAWKCTYTNASGNIVTTTLTNDLAIYGNATLTAQWYKRADTKYTLRYWLEGPDGDPGRIDSDNWEFLTDIPKYGTTESSISVAASSLDTSKVGVRYYYDSNLSINKTSVTIKPDGSAVKDVYFRRRWYKVTFYTTPKLVANIKWGEKAKYWDPNNLVKSLFKKSGSKLSFLYTKNGNYGIHYVQWYGNFKDAVRITGDASVVDTLYDADSYSWMEDDWAEYAWPVRYPEEVTNSGTGTAITAAEWPWAPRYWSGFHDYIEVDDSDSTWGSNTNDVKHSVTEQINGKTVTRNVKFKYTAHIYHDGNNDDCKTSVYDPSKRYVLYAYGNMNNASQEVVVNTSNGYQSFTPTYLDTYRYWIVNRFNLEFVNQGEKALQTIQVRLGAKIKDVGNDLLNDAKNYQSVKRKVGNSYYDFEGWFTSEDAASDPTNPENLQYKVDLGSTSLTMQQGGIKLYGGWSIAHHRVHFVSNCETVVPDQDMVVSGEPMDDPGELTNSNKRLTFVAWYTDPNYGNRWDFQNPVTQDMTLYARWASYDSFPVLYRGENGETLEGAAYNSDIHYAFGSRVVVPPAPLNSQGKAQNEDGDLFAGWSIRKNDMTGIVPNMFSIGEDVISGEAGDEKVILYAVYESESERDSRSVKPILAYDSNYPKSLGKEDVNPPYQVTTRKNNDAVVLMSAAQAKANGYLSTKGNATGGQEFYVLTGWNTKKDQSTGKLTGSTLALGSTVGVAYDDETNPTVTLYAEWVPTREAGAAYAVLGADGTLTFFRSDKEFGQGTTSIEDISGVVRKGTIWRVPEYGDGTEATVPWAGSLGSIRRVAVAEFPTSLPGSDGTHIYQALHPASTARWFDGCANLTSVELPEVDTSAVTDFSSMFKGCAKLESLDIGDVNTLAATDMGDMFSGCSKLREVSLGTGWSFKGHDIADAGKWALLPTPTTGSDSPYTGYWMMGSMKRTAAELQGEYVGSSHAGVWILESDLIRPYAVLVGDTLHFVLSESASGASASVTDLEGNLYEGIVYPLKNLAAGVVPWSSQTKIVYVKSYAGMVIAPTATAGWFSGLSNLESADLSGLDTSAATDMSGMFDGCGSLESVTLGATFSFKGNCIADESKWVELPTHGEGSALATGYTGKWAHADGDATYALAAADLAAAYPSADTAPAGEWVWQRETYEIAFHALDAAADAEGNVAERTWYEWHGRGLFTDADLTVAVDRSAAVLPQATTADDFLGYFTEPRGRGTLMVGPDGKLTDAFTDACFHGGDSSTVDDDGVGHLFPHWKTDEAYAVLQGGTLYLVRSSDAVDVAGETATFKDLDGRSYEGKAWKLDETATYGAAQDVPWHDVRGQITEVVSFEGQQIVPASTAHWFEGMASLATADLSGLDTSGTGDMTDMFKGTTGLSSVTLAATFSFVGNGSASCSLLDAPTGDGLTGRWTNGTEAVTAAVLAGKCGVELKGIWMWERSITFPIAGGPGQSTAAAWLAASAVCAAALWLRRRRGWA